MVIARIKRIIAGILSVLSFCAVFSACSISADGAPVLYANVFHEGKESCDTVKVWRKNEEELFLFLPSGTDFSSLKLWCKPAGRVSVNGETIKNGKVCHQIAADGTYTLTCGKDTFRLTVISSRDVPAIFIETDSGSLDAIHADKAHKEGGQIRVYEHGEQTADVRLDYIKGRGNQTWTGEKRPYNIRFAEKLPLLGMDPAKKWCLLANASDDTLLRNTIALTLAQRMEIPYACDCRAADLYINGDYRGSYLVTEKVEVSDAVVDITDLEKLNEIANPGVKIGAMKKCSTGDEIDRENKRWTDIPVSPDDITGGYLIEFDQAYYENEQNGFITKRGQYVTVKSPADASKEEIDYISDFCNAAEEALASENGWNHLGEYYSDYYDVISLAKVFVLHEFLLNGDVYFSSNYFSKERGGKLVAGPVWDFDMCLQNAGSDSLFKPENWCVNLWCINYYNLNTSVFEQAFHHVDFRKEAARQWKKLRDVFSDDAMDELVRSLAESIKYSAAADHFRWTKKIFVSAEEWADIYVGYCQKLTMLAGARAAFLDKGLLGSCAMLYYDLNGVRGWMFSEKIAVEGESVPVKEMGENALLTPIIPDGYIFAGWNTAADGSGKAYAPGEEIVLTAPSTVLYAQWDQDK